MHVLASVILAASSVFAYQVTSPGATSSQGWTTAGPNYLTWNRVDTDPLNFTVVLTNVNTQVMPTGQILNALVDGTLGRISCNPPSGGWPTGTGFRVNLAQDAEHIDSLLAQSGQFSITAPTTTISATTSSQLVTGSSTTTSAPYIPGVSSSDTNTTPTGTSNAVLSADTQSTLFVSFAALTALITTLF